MPHRHATVLLVLIVLASLGAVLAGWYFGPAMTQVGWLGEIFLNLLQMLIVPLILAAVISGVASLGDIRRLGRLGGLTIGYYLATLCIAVAIGLTLVNLIEPGTGLELSTDGEIPEKVAAAEATEPADLLLAMVSPNIIASAAEMDILPLILFAILFASALTVIGEAGQPVIRFFHGLNEAIMRVVIWIMYLSPLGIFGLIAARLGEAGGGDAILGELSAVGWHVTTVMSGLALHFLVLVLILVFIAHRPIGYLAGMARALFTALGTASSAATLPATLEGVRENGVDERAVRFVTPLGSTVNMDGTALYEAAAVLFIAQAYGVELGAGEQLIVFITAVLAAVGAASIPEAGLVMMVIILTAVGLPLEGIGLLLAVDWLLDRFRTATNVWSDAVGAAVVDRFLPQTGITEAPPLART